MKFRALCTDIDGTLLDANRQLSRITIAAIKKLNKKIPVILASSRMPSAMRHLQHELDIIHHPMICFNGGFVIHYDADDKLQIVDSVFIPADICAGIIELTKNTSIHSSLYFEDNWYAPQHDRWTLREETVTKVKAIIQTPEEVIEYWSKHNLGAHKVMCMGPEEEIDDLEKKLISRFSADLNIYRSRTTYIEIAPKQISKGSALALLLERKFDIHPSEVIAFGDNYNDIELLKIAGHGVAVNNANDEVKAVANEITIDSKADGVAIIIQKYFGD